MGPIIRCRDYIDRLSISKTDNPYTKLSQYVKELQEVAIKNNTAIIMCKEMKRKEHANKRIHYLG